MLKMLLTSLPRVLWRWQSHNPHNRLIFSLSILISSGQSHSHRKNANRNGFLISLAHAQLHFHTTTCAHALTETRQHANTHAHSPSHTLTHPHTHTHPPTHPPTPTSTDTLTHRLQAVPAAKPSWSAPAERETMGGDSIYMKKTFSWKFEIILR